MGAASRGPSTTGPTHRAQFFWLWAPTVLEMCTHIAINHEADGRAWHESGAVVPRLADGEPALDPGRVQCGTGTGFDVTWQSGTRWAERIMTRLEMWGSDDVEVSYEPFLTFQMSGIGYRHPVWGHGCWVGNDESTRDALVLADVNPLDPLMVARAGAVARHLGRALRRRDRRTTGDRTAPADRPDRHHRRRHLTR